MVGGWVGLRVGRGVGEGVCVCGGMVAGSVGQGVGAGVGAPPADAYASFRAALALLLPEAFAAADRANAEEAALTARTAEAGDDFSREASSEAAADPSAAISATMASCTRLRCRVQLVSVLLCRSASHSAEAPWSPTQFSSRLSSSSFALLQTFQVCK